MRSDATISLVDAARLIFRTRTPNDKQVHRVYEQMKAGALRVRDYGGPPLKWTTTEAALADFLAAHQIERTLGHSVVEAAKQRAKAPHEIPAKPPVNFDEESAKLRDVYRGIWRDYFLAVMLRRRMAHRSVAFRRWVVIGQIALLVSLVGIFIGGLRWILLPIPPEHAAICRWIDENTDAYHVTRFHPPEPHLLDVRLPPRSGEGWGGGLPSGTGLPGQGSVWRVEYRYQKESRRWIHTDRRFHVLGDDVREIAVD